MDHIAALFKSPGSSPAHVQEAAQRMPNMRLLLFALGHFSSQTPTIFTHSLRPSAVLTRSCQVLSRLISHCLNIRMWELAGCQACFAYMS